MATFRNIYTGRVVTVDGNKAVELAGTRRWQPYEQPQGDTVAELRDRCRDRGLPVYGSKAELLARLEGDG